jgi:hypothetical protein
MRYSTKTTDTSTARHLAGIVRKLEPIGVTVPKKILDAVTRAEEALPTLEQQRVDVVGMVGQTGPDFTKSIADGDLTGEQILARLVGADLDPTRVNHTFAAAQTAVGATLRNALRDHGEKWVPALRAVIEERADMVYSGVYDPDALDPKRDPRGAEYALRDDATALAWGELTTLWSVATVFHQYGILPGTRRPDAYLFSTPTEVRGEKDHHDFTRFIVMCREEHEPSLYTEQEVQQFEAEHAERGAPSMPRDRYTAAGFQRSY